MRIHADPDPKHCLAQSTDLYDAKAFYTFEHVVHDA